MSACCRGFSQNNFVGAVINVEGVAPPVANAATVIELTCKIRVYPMFCSHFISSFPEGDGETDGKPVANPTNNMTEINALPRPSTMEVVEHTRGGSKRLRTSDLVSKR